MALEDNSSAITYSPQQVAAAFVNQYYQTLHNSQEHVHRFYSDSSTLGREDSNGNMTSVTTMHGINSQIMSTDYTGYVIELQTVDTQASYMGGVLILVTGSFTTPDAVKKKFTQSFFLAPQGNGAYFVLNDMFRFVSEVPSTVMDQVSSDHDNESTQDTLPAESEKASAHESMVPDEPSTASLPVNNVVTSLSANDTGVDTLVNVVKNLEMSEAAPTPALKAATSPAPVEKTAPAPASAEKTAPTTPAEKATPAPAPPKDVIKKTYASILKEMGENTLPAPAPTVKPKPSPRSKATQNAEKSVVTPSKPAQANTALPGEKSIPKSKQSDEPGYSIFVKNLPYNATVQMVEQEFKKFGAIKPGGIQVRNRQFEGFCFGFVEFESQHSMQEALKAHTVYFGSIESYIEEKRTTTRVVNGVVTRGDDNGNAGGSRFQSGRGGYQGANFRGRGEVYRGNGSYHDSGRGQGPRGNGYYQNRNGYHQIGNGYAQNVNQQRRPSQTNDGLTGRPTKQTPAAA